MRSLLAATVRERFLGGWDDPSLAVGASVLDGNRGVTMTVPLAYFITFTAYGTWLPGDERGLVDYKTAAPDAPIQPPDAERYQQARNQLKHPVVKLSEELRQVVMQTVKEVCEYRGWALLAVNCR